MSGTLPVKPPWKKRRKNPPFLKFSYPIFIHTNNHTPATSNAHQITSLSPFRSKSQGPKVPRHMECLSLNGWRVCQQKVHHNPRHGKKADWLQPGGFLQKVMFWKPKGPQGWNPPNPSRTISFRPKKARSFWEQMGKTIHINYSIPILLGVGCVLFWWFQWNPYMHFKALKLLGDVYLSSTCRQFFPGTIPVTVPFTISGMSNTSCCDTYCFIKKNTLLKTVRCTLRLEIHPH